jgi:hypothetical protein
MTQPVPDKRNSLLVSPDLDRIYRKSCFLSVLCVSGDPVFLDQIRNNLELRSSIFVETTVTVEDALHLMDYLSFDAVVTDCTSWHGEQDGFLKAMRKQEPDVPFIYFIRGSGTGILEDTRQYGMVRHLVWGTWESSPPFDELAWYIHELAASGPDEKARVTSGRAAYDR